MKGEYGKYCHNCCEHFRNGECCVDEDAWKMSGPAPCEVLPWEELEEIAAMSDEDEYPEVDKVYPCDYDILGECPFGPYHSCEKCGR